MALVFAFFVTALLYASVGFGGGSTYNALLALADTNYRVMPVIALLCNLIVVSGGTYRFARAGYIDFRRISPWIAASVPAAWLGGFFPVSETIFMGLLGFSLLLAGLQLLFQPSEGHEAYEASLLNKHPSIPLIMGAILGSLAGLTGIGGGIFLAPLLYLSRWESAKVIAGTCSFFILVNSLSGLAGQLMKAGDPGFLGAIGPYWMLFPAVLAGGQIGSFMGAVRLNQKFLRVATAILILYVALRLLCRWWEMALG